jgi:GH18 family chitinase
MLDNHTAQTWDDVRQTDKPLYNDPGMPPLERVETYVDHCFDTYPVVSRHLDRERVQVCIADWGRRRGQARQHRRLTKRKFGQRIPASADRRVEDNHALIVATALVGVSPEDDKGVGWKATVRHELGHIIDYEKRGTSDHSQKFKRIMGQFGHEVNEGKSSGGYPPRYFR